MKWLALLLLSAPQGAREERGKYRLSCPGHQAGSEEYRLETFEDGHVGLFSKSRGEDRSGSWTSDTVLTLDANYRPVRYAAYHREGSKDRRSKVDWEGATTVELVVDAHVVAHFLPLLRRFDVERKRLKAHLPAAGGDAEIRIEERRRVVLRAGEREVRARTFRIVLPDGDVTAYFGGEGRILRLEDGRTGVIAALEEFEGLAPGPLVRRPAGVEETEVTVPNGGLALHGALTRPSGTDPCPAVVLLSDEGPHDRNGLDRPEGEPILQEVAYALSAAGVMVLRMDDRDLSRATLDDLAGDGRASVSWLKARKDVTAVGLVGHGEGGWTALRVAAGGEVTAVFLFEFDGRPVEEILLEREEKRLRAEASSEEAIEKILKMRRAELAAIRASEGDVVTIDERPTFVGRLRDRLRLDPGAEARAAKASVTLIHSPGLESTLKVLPDVEARPIEELPALVAERLGTRGGE